MPYHLDTQKVFTSRSERVKCVDLHPKLPWILASMYNGTACIFDYQTGQMLKQCQVSDTPARTCKFIPKKNWFIVGADDLKCRVYNYNTMEKVKEFETHNDYMRSISIHHTKPVLITSSDDFTIRAWDWERNFECVQLFEGHQHFVMQVEFNPRDSNTFASASLDRTIKIWGLDSRNAHFTLEGHEKGVNAVAYCHNEDNPYIVSGADDRTIRVWDYQNKTCIHVLQGHSHNVSSVMFHPDKPFVFSGSEDGTLRVWHTGTYKLENTLNFGMERVWSVSCAKDSLIVAAGCDDGTVAFKIGSSVPVCSMDNTGKVIWAKDNEIKTCNVRTAGDAEDGEALVMPIKDLGTCELYPQSLSHNPNGRFVVVSGSGEFIVYTALAWRNKTFGNALDFVWSDVAGVYAVRSSPYQLKVYKNFKETFSIRPKFQVDELFGGHLLSARSGEFLSISSWDNLSTIRRIDVKPKDVKWSDSGDVMAVICEDSFYMLRYNRDAVFEAIEKGEEIPEEGIEDAFDVITEVSECIVSSRFVGDCLVYVNAAGRLCYCIGTEVTVVSHLDASVYILGYLSSEDRLYLIDRKYEITSFHLSNVVLQYQTAIANEDIELANEMLPKIPSKEKGKIARFLETQGYAELALEVSDNDEYKFDLAVSLKKLELVSELATRLKRRERWKELADLALRLNEFEIAETAMKQARDLNGLLLLYSSIGNGEGIAEIARMAKEDGLMNIAFLSSFVMRDLIGCSEVLEVSKRESELKFFEMAYDVQGGQKVSLAAPKAEEEAPAAPVAEIIEEIIDEVPNAAAAEVEDKEA